MKGLLLCLVCTYLSFELTAQTVLDNNPSRLKWNQVNTEHFRVLFPVGFDTSATRVANTLEYIHAPEARTLGRGPRKISVILQNQSSLSNGFVSMIPRRSEFYTMPAQDYNFLGNNDWLGLLSSHEYRHIVQNSHAIRGLNKWIYFLFGAPTMVGVSHAAVPQWFWEGDAVATETAFTPGGRGRIPHFGLVFKTNLIEGRKFNYHKQYLRSYKHYVPDHYVLGYYMVSHLRRKTQDPEIWSKVTARAWNVPIMPFTFSNALHRETGSYVRAVYKEMVTTMKQEWQAEINAITVSEFERVNVRKNSSYTDFLYPQAMDDGSVTVMKRGIGEIEQFVNIRDGKETKIFTPGFVNDAGMLSGNADRIVWTEYGFDARWRVKTFSRIKIYEQHTNEHWIVANPRDRYAAAALSPDGNKLVVIRSREDYKNELLILNAATGSTLKIFPNAQNFLYSMPRWSPDGKSVVALKTGKGGKTISELDVSGEKFRDLMPLSDENVGHPVLTRHYVLFNSPASGIDNIYAVDLTNGKRYQVTSSKYGAYNPSVTDDEQWLYYNDQSRDGLDVVRVPFKPASWNSFIDGAPSVTERLAESLVEQEGTAGFWDSIPQNALSVNRYSKLSGIINPYGWGAFVGNDLTQINIGIASRDILSTTSLSAGYMWDIDERTSAWKTSISYQGLYPIIDLDALSGNRKSDKTAFGNEIEFKWKESTIEGGLRLPFLLTRSKYSRSLTVGSAIGLTRTNSFENTVSENGSVIYNGTERITPVNDTLIFVYKDQLNNGDLIYNRFNFSFFNLLKRSQRDFLYRWGQTLEADLYNTPFNGDFEGRLFAIRSTLYFPGLAKHHFLNLRLAYQEQLQSAETNIYTFRNQIPKPRGHEYPDDGTFAAGSINYALPLWYPDIDIGPILYIQRVKANVFYDVGKGTGKVYYYDADSNRVYFSSSNETYQSVGIETTFDFNIFRLLPKLELGFRSTYRIANDFNTSGLVFEFMVGNIGF
ncbi:MAG: hypothetical protein WKF87_20160 [Chryseolinea sp.]